MALTGGFLSSYLPPGMEVEVGGATISGTGARISQQYGGTMPLNDGGTPALSELNYRELAGNMFPWLTSGLLDLFADQWAETGNAQFALDAVRRSPEYVNVFPGIKRDDGSLRMSEGEYFSERAGFREALSEFGYDPGQYEAQFAKLFENEVDARELYQAVEQATARFTEPGSGRTALADVFLSEFMGSGSSVAALQAVRDSSEYDSVFAGNRREDGTLRMEEQDYFAYKRGWQRTLVSYGLNPAEFEARGRFEETVENEVSIQEVDQRLQAAQTGILDQISQVESFYMENYGIAAPEGTRSAILASSIDPDIRRDILERRITASQIGGEASLAGFSRTVERAEELARAGLSQDQARGLYSEAAERVPTLDFLASRFNDPEGGIGIQGYENAAALGDAGTRQRIQRRLDDERSAFSTRQGVRRDQEGTLTGLTQR